MVSQYEFFNKRVASTNASNYFLLKRGDFAYNKSYSAGYPLGVIRRLEKYQHGIVSPLYICFRPNQSVNPDFLLHYFEGGMVNAGIADIAKEGVRNHGLLNVGVNDFFDLEVALPSLEEQGDIAQILDTLDTAIRETEAIVAKLQAVKQGLLHDLLTRGLDASGQLRPPPALAPELYQDSPLGLIPREWEVGSIDDYLERIIDYRGKTPVKTSSGIPLITARNVRLGYVDPEPCEYISEDDFDSWMTRGIPQKGDVLFTTEAPLGNVAQISSDERLAFAQRLIVLQCKSALFNSFLKCLLLDESFRARLFGLSSGSTVEGIKQSTFRKLKICIPSSLDEQKNIVARIQMHESTIDAESLSLSKLRELKSGLMDDLLTGRVRVKVLDTEKA